MREHEILPVLHDSRAINSQLKNCHRQHRLRPNRTSPKLSFVLYIYSSHVGLFAALLLLTLSQTDTVSIPSFIAWPVIQGEKHRPRPM